MLPRIEDGSEKNFRDFYAMMKINIEYTNYNIRKKGRLLNF